MFVQPVQRLTSSDCDTHALLQPSRTRLQPALCPNVTLCPVPVGQEQGAQHYKALLFTPGVFAPSSTHTHTHIAPLSANLRRMPDAMPVPDTTSVPLPSSSTSTREEGRASDSTVLQERGGEAHTHRTAGVCQVHVAECSNDQLRQPHTSATAAEA